MNNDNWFVADFETKSEKFYLENGYTEIWLYAICDSNANIVNYGSNMDEFIYYVKRKLYGKIVYFHNLKFDGSFIIDYLFSRGYEYYDDLTKVNKGFKLLASDTGEFYSLDVKFSKGKQVHFHDSLKLLPFKVRKIAEDFELPILKGKINYEDYTISDKALNYVYNDVRIVAMALSQIKSEGMTKMTTASCAYNMYSSLRDKTFWSVAFPELPTELLKVWRNAYRGGRSQVNRMHKDKILRGVRRYDINSMYPYIMHDFPLPYGQPIKYNGRDKYDFEIYRVRIGFVLKPNCLPSLLKKHLSLTEDSYYEETEDIEEMWISNIDLQLVERNYDVYHLEILDTYGFRTSKILFRDYIDYWYGKKLNDKGVKRIVDKFMLNCLYGKFGTNIEKAHKIPYYQDGIVGYSNSDYAEGKKYYLPVAIAITSYAHLLIDNAIHMTGIDNFVYCDTDSVHTLGTLPDNMVDAKLLGKFKEEAYETKSKYIRQKCYITLENGEYKITCAGLPDELKEDLINTFGDNVMYVFGEGLTVNGKLMPKRVPGGTIFHETTFKIN